MSMVCQTVKNIHNQPKNIGGSTVNTVISSMPTYELDSVNEVVLESAIFQLGLKFHNKDSFDARCFVCRENLIHVKSLASRKAP